MHTAETKLAHLLKDKDLAAALVAAGLDSPRKIKAAPDGVLDKVHGVGKGGRQKLRERFPKEKVEHGH